jgi:heme o synthase
MVCRHYLQLAKVRLTALILLTTAVGYVLGSIAQEASASFSGVALALLGTGLAAAGASALNQLMEIGRDAKMRRTCNRPLPAGRIARPHAFLFAMLATAAGLGTLNEWVNPLTSLLGLLDVLIYVLVYTPLKSRTSLCTLIGSICGALPPVMGWAAATGSLSPGAALLGCILFLWQVPHTLSLVWLHREDYAAAGYRMLPVVDPSGRLTCLTIVLYWLALMPLGVAATLLGLAGYLFAVASLLLGLAMFLLALQFRAAKTQRNARRLFWASIAYLPLLFLSLVADRPSEGVKKWGQAPRETPISQALCRPARSQSPFLHNPSHQIYDRKQHAPNRVEKVPIDGRIADAAVIAGRVSAGPGAARDDGQRRQPRQHVRGM